MMLGSSPTKVEPHSAMAFTFHLTRSFYLEGNEEEEGRIVN